MCFDEKKLLPMIHTFFLLRALSSVHVRQLDISPRNCRFSICLAHDSIKTLHCKALIIQQISDVTRGTNTTPADTSVNIICFSQICKVGRRTSGLKFNVSGNSAVFATSGFRCKLSGGSILGRSGNSGEVLGEREDIELASGSFGLCERFEVLLCY